MVGVPVVNAQPVRPACGAPHAAGTLAVPPAPLQIFFRASHSPIRAAPILHVLWCAGSSQDSFPRVTAPYAGSTKSLASPASATVRSTPVGVRAGD